LIFDTFKEEYHAFEIRTGGGQTLSYILYPSHNFEVWRCKRNEFGVKHELKEVVIPVLMDNAKMVVFKVVVELLNKEDLLEVHLRM